LINVTLAGAASSFTCALAEVAGSLTIGAGVIFSGSTQTAAAAQHGGSITQSGAGPAVSGTPAYSTAAVFATSLGVYACASGATAWSGAATGPRYLSILNSVINTNGADTGAFFPG